MKPKFTLTMVWGTMVLLTWLGALAIFTLSPKDPSFRKPAALLMIFILGGTAALISISYVRRARMKPIAHRQSLPPEEIFLKYYKDIGLREDVVIHIWREIAGILALPAEKLRPTDRFNDELKPLGGWYHYDDHLSWLFAWAEKYARSHGAKIDPAEIKTLDDLVRCLSVL
jgi:hypothetical protein